MSREYKNAQEALAADIAGDDSNSSTSLLNGWGGTIYYEKLSTSMTLAHLYVTTIGTTANGTILFTLAAGYRPEFALRALIISSFGTDGAGGYIEISTNGDIKIYDFNASVLNFRTQITTYMARN